MWPTRPEGMIGEIVEVGKVFGFLAPVQRGAERNRSRQVQILTHGTRSEGNLPLKNNSFKLNLSFPPPTDPNEPIETSLAALPPLFSLDLFLSSNRDGVANQEEP